MIYILWSSPQSKFMVPESRRLKRKFPTRDAFENPIAPLENPMKPIVNSLFGIDKGTLISSLVSLGIV